MNEKRIISVLLENNFNWNRVNTQPCVHTFYGNFYINLCQWKPNGLNTISIDVDDVEEGKNDIISLDIKEGDDYFKSIMSIYNLAIKSAENIAA